MNSCLNNIILLNTLGICEPLNGSDAPTKPAKAEMRVSQSEAELAKMGKSILEWKEFKDHAFFLGETALKKSSSLEQVGQFQPNLAQRILR